MQLVAATTSPVSEGLLMLAPAVSAPVDRSGRLFNLTVGVILTAWLGIVLRATVTGQFVTEAGQPPLALLAAVLLPVVLSVVVYGSSARVRELVRAGDPEFLTMLQGWRILGGVFLVLLWFGMLPGAFALPAGLGDVAIGVTAPFVARALAVRGPEGAGRLFVTWQWLGILDLVVAVGTGAASRTFPGSVADPASAERMISLSQLPLSLIPTFAVPLFVILHLASLAQYRDRVQRGGQ
jgi:hypothetical protein